MTAAISGSLAVESDGSAIPAVFDYGWKYGARASGDITDMSAFFLSALKGLSAREIALQLRTEHR
jgi:hypothetical protein